LIETLRGLFRRPLSLPRPTRPGRVVRASSPTRASRALVEVPMVLWKRAPPSLCSSRSAATAGSMPASAISEAAVWRSRWKVKPSNTDEPSLRRFSSFLTAASIERSQTRSRKRFAVHRLPSSA